MTSVKLRAAQSRHSIRVNAEVFCSGSEQEELTSDNRCVN